MLVIFRRTGERRYGVQIQRPQFEVVEMNPAPGYDPLIPHDLMHMVVEAQLGLTHGIFGQVAAGGHAGTFKTYVGPAKNPRDASRRQRRIDRRGKKLMRRAGPDDCLQSERATFICLHEWLARSKSSARRKVAAGMTAEAKHVYGITETDLRALSEQKIQEICRHLDELSSHWSKLKVGESMAVRWPDLSLVQNSLTPARLRA